MELSGLLPSEYEEHIFQEVITSPKPDCHNGDFHPYYWSCEIRSLRLAKRFLQFGLDPNGKNFDGSTALTWAPNYEFTHFFLNAGAKVCNEKDGPFLSLHRAAEVGRVDQLRLLLMKGDGANFLESQDEFGNTPLSVASRFGNLDCVSFLLDKGASVNNYGEVADYSSLQYALSEGYEEIARLLLNKGADPTDFPPLSESPISLAKSQMLSSSIIKSLTG